MSADNFEVNGFKVSLREFMSENHI